MRIRVATVDDAEKIREIYAPFVLSSPVTFDTQVPTVEQMRATIAKRLRHYPWLVAEGEEGVVAYAYGAEHRPRSAYRWSVDVSVYVQPRHQRKGIGRQLYQVLLPLLRRQGFYMAHAGITIPNPASVRLHESFGFRHVGTFPNVGYEQGAWHDVGWWALELQPPNDTPPAEPKPFDIDWILQQ